MRGVLSEDPLKRLIRYYRTAAVWGALLLSATFLENVPIFGGNVYLIPFVPPIAGWRRGRIVGFFVGIVAGFLHDWTAEGGFGIAGIVLGAIGYGSGVWFA